MEKARKIINFESGENMTREQEKQVVDALVDFVIRVSLGNVQNETETKVLPTAATLLLVNKF